MRETPTVLFLGKSNFIINKLTSLLVQKNCNVLYSSATTYKDLENIVGTTTLAKINYVIYVSLSTFLFKPKTTLLKDDTKREELILSFVKKAKARVVAVYSYLQKKELQEKTETNTTHILDELKGSLAVVYLGDILQNINQVVRPPNESILGQTLIKIVKNTNLNLQKSFLFYPVLDDKACTEIIRILFSLNYYNSSVAILGKSVRVDRIIESVNKKSFSLHNFSLNKNFLVSPTVGAINNLESKTELKLFLKGLPKHKVSESFQFSTTPSTKDIYLRNKLVTFVLACVLVTFPVWVLFASNSLIISARKSFEKGNILSSNIYSKISYKLLMASKPFNLIIPPLSEPHKFLLKQNEVLTKLNTTANNVFKINQILFNTTSDLPNALYGEITRDLQIVYEDLGQIQSGLTSKNIVMRKLIAPNTKKEQLILFKQQIYNLVALSRELPDLLGEEETKKYLLVLEDPNLLMPGGGKIEKIYLITIAKGKIINTNSIDPELGKNTISELITTKKNYKEFFKNGWYLKNANISPDFITSAKQIVFFTDKQQDIKADGVVSLNTHLVIGKEVPTTRGDLYTLLHSVIGELQKNTIQLFSDNDDVEKMLTNFDWEGSIKKPVCVNSCHQDNLNYFELSLNDQSKIFREINLQVSLEEKIIKRKMSVFLENKGDANYKGYVNVLVPDNSGFSPTIFLGEKKDLTVSTDIFNVGDFKVLSTFVEVPINTSKTLLFSWDGGTNLGLKNTDEYVLSVGKQGGMNNVKLNVNLKAVNKNIYPGNSDFTLTPSSDLVYNALLLQDKVLRVYFK